MNEPYLSVREFSDVLANAVDAKRTFQIQRKKNNRLIKTEKLQVIKIYFKRFIIIIYSKKKLMPLSSKKNWCLKYSRIYNYLVKKGQNSIANVVKWYISYNIGARALNKRSQVFLSDVPSKIVQWGSLSITWG